MMQSKTPERGPFDPGRWGLPREAILGLGEALYAFWERFRSCFRTRTRDTSEQAYTYLRAQLTMEEKRNFANMDRRLNGGDGQNLQEFMSNSPWSAQRLFGQIRVEIAARPALQSGGVLILDESADEKAGQNSAGAGRQHNGRLGKVDLCQVSTCLAYSHPATRTWALVDGELFLPEAWFGPEYAELRERVGVPPDREFATKPALGLAMLRRVRAEGLPFDFVVCDDLYGRNRTFRETLDAEGIQYAAEVPANTVVFLQRPKGKRSRKKARAGRGAGPEAPRAWAVREVAENPKTRWRKVVVRYSERGELRAEFAVQRVWTLTKEDKVRGEWLVIRREGDGECTFLLLNAPLGTSPLELVQRSCQRYFVERTFQDAKSQLGWDDFQAQKYLAWEHHLALTAAALWFVAEVKLSWREEHARDPELARQLEVEVLPLLSTANVRELLRAVLPLPQFSPEQALEQVISHLVKRARSTSSRLKRQREEEGSFP